jgi:dipeptidyl aminopeptidase/acylaminoacyl peptidase
MHADGTGLFELAEQGPTEQLVRSDPTWSPDNEQLAYLEQVADRGSLIMINRDGTGRRVVSVGDFTPPDTDQPVSPIWSPDGLKIAFLEWVNNRPTLKSIDTETLEITSHDQFISYEAGPLWVPFDGDHGEPAAAVKVTEAGQPVWKVINLTTGDTANRTGGLVLVAPLLDWWIAENGRLWSAEYVPQEMNLPEGTTWGPGNNQLVVPTDEGLLLLEIGKDVERLITQEDTDAMPVWSEPLYFVLP